MIGSLRPLDIGEILPQRRFESAMSSAEYGRHLVHVVDLAERARGRSHDELQAYIQGTRAVNTDDLPILEFHSLRNRLRKY